MFADMKTFIGEKRHSLNQIKTFFFLSLSLPLLKNDESLIKKVQSLIVAAPVEEDYPKYFLAKRSSFLVS